MAITSSSSDKRGNAARFLQYARLSVGDPVCGMFPVAFRGQGDLSDRIPGTEVSNGSDGSERAFELRNQSPDRGQLLVLKRIFDGFTICHDRGVHVRLKLAPFTEIFMQHGP